MRGRNTTIVAIIAIVIVVAGLFWWNAHRSAPPTPSGDNAPNVDLARATYGTIDVTVHAAGRLGSGSGSQIKLAFVTAGRIASVNVHVGETVSAGDTLASLDSAGLVLAQQQAQADVRAAEASAAAASVDRTSTKVEVDRRALERETRLYDAGVAARKDVEAARAQLAADAADASANAASAAAARAQVASAAAKARGASYDVSTTALRAPISGIVTAVYHVAGESVDPSTAVVAIASSSTSAATVTVTANDLARIHEGDAVTLRLQGTEPIEGRVAGVPAAVDPTTQQADVRVAASVPLALAGSAADAVIVVAHDRGVLVPHDAVVIDPASGDALVFLPGKDKDGNATFVQRKIHVVYDDGARTEITGVRPGERVAAHGTFELLAPSGGGD